MTIVAANQPAKKPNSNSLIDQSPICNLITPGADLGLCFEHVARYPSLVGVPHVTGSQQSGSSHAFVIAPSHTDLHPGQPTNSCELSNGLGARNRSSCLPRQPHPSQVSLIRISVPDYHFYPVTAGRLYVFQAVTVIGNRHYRMSQTRDHQMVPRPLPRNR